MPGPTPDQVASYQQLANQTATKYGLDPNIFAAMIGKESGWDPNIRGSSGEYGLGQLMPATAAGLGVTNPLDPAQNLDGAARYLSQQLATQNGDYARALAAYNGGPGGVNLPQAQAYAADVLQRAGNPANTTTGAGTPTVTPTGGPMDWLSGAWAGVTNFFWNVFLRVAVILIGLVLIWQGLAMLRNTSVVENVKVIVNRGGKGSKGQPPAQVTTERAA